MSIERTGSVTEVESKAFGLNKYKGLLRRRKTQTLGSKWIKSSNQWCFEADFWK